MQGSDLWINEIRVFSVINLLEGATVIESPEEWEGFVVNNLVENLETRSMNRIDNAITDWDESGWGVTRST